MGHGGGAVRDRGSWRPAWSGWMARRPYNTKDLLLNPYHRTATAAATGSSYLPERSERPPLTVTHSAASGRWTQDGGTQRLARALPAPPSPGVPGRWTGTSSQSRRRLGIRHRSSAEDTLAAHRLPARLRPHRVCLGVPARGTRRRSFLSSNDYAHAPDAFAGCPASRARSATGSAGQVIARHGLTQVVPADFGRSSRRPCARRTIFGNPPFGHAGGDGIRQFFEERRSGVADRRMHRRLTQDFARFGATPRLSRRRALVSPDNFGGMQLALATSAASRSIRAVRCSTPIRQSAASPSKFNYFGPMRRWCSTRLRPGSGSIRYFRRLAAPSASFPARTADDICYRIVDLVGTPCACASSNTARCWTCCCRSWGLRPIRRA